MAYPVDFKGTNIIMKAPDGAENVNDVRAFTNGVTCVTCWELSAEEIADITLSGKIFLSIFMGGGMPPAAVGSETEIRNMVADYGVWPKAEPEPEWVTLKDWTVTQTSTRLIAKSASYEVEGKDLTDLNRKIRKLSRDISALAKEYKIDTPQQEWRVVWHFSEAHIVQGRML